MADRDSTNQSESRAQRKKREREERRSHLRLVVTEPQPDPAQRPQPRPTIGRLIAQTALLADSASARDCDAAPQRQQSHPDPRRSRRGFGWFI